ncbi:hypothetical protein GCM10020000_15140 [Streptomyces olivoverticillatus]
MYAVRHVRKGLIAATLAACLALPMAGAAQAAPTPHKRPPAAATSTGGRPAAARPADGRPPTSPTGSPSRPRSRAAPPCRAAARSTPDACPAQPPVPHPPSGKPAKALDGTVPCTLDGITGLDPEHLADFLTDPAVTADGCLHGLIWTWDARLAPVMSRAHVQAVSRRIAALAPGHGGTDATHLYELFTYLHAAVYQDFSHDEIDLTDPATVGAMRSAIDAFAAAAHTFDPTRQNAGTLREALTAGSAPGLRQHQLGLVTRVLATLAPPAPPRLPTPPGAAPPWPRSRSTTSASTPATRTPPSSRPRPPTPATAPPSAPSPATPTSRTRPTPGPCAMPSANTAASARSTACAPPSSATSAPC